MITSVFCWLGFHRASPGVDKSVSLVWVCRKCGSLQSGGMAVRR